MAHFDVLLDVLDLLPNGSVRLGYRQCLESEIQTLKSRRMKVLTTASMLAGSRDPPVSASSPLPFTPTPSTRVLR